MFKEPEYYDFESWWNDLYSALSKHETFKEVSYSSSLDFIAYYEHDYTPEAVMSLELGLT